MASVTPGEKLKKQLADDSNNVSTIARIIGISRQHLYQVFENNAPITANLAARIAIYTNTDYWDWVDAQNAFDLAKIDYVNLTDEICLRKEQENEK